VLHIPGDGGEVMRQREAVIRTQRVAAVLAIILGVGTGMLLTTAPQHLLQ